MEDKLTLAQGIIGGLGPVIGIIAVVAVIGWVITTWMRIRHGYPLDGAWGQAVYPRSNDEAVERVKLLTQENAQLRAEIGSIKDRLGNIERIVTDEAHSLNREIEQLRGKTN
jgi:predicted metal-binding membrane protein